MTSNHDDASEAARFDDPTARDAIGAAHTPPAGQRLTTHVPVRFSPRTVARVRILADQDGKSVSAWIRDVVDRQVELRWPSSSVTEGRAVLIVDGSMLDGLQNLVATQGVDPDVSEELLSVP